MHNSFSALQPKVKKKKKGGYDIETEIAECMEIIGKGIREKKLSDKINYNVLSALDATAPSETSPDGPIEIIDEGSANNLTEQKSQILNRYFSFFFLLFFFFLN